jgi:glutaminyl-peptide cyclotransferase
MHFGPGLINSMKHKHLFYIAALALGTYSCKPDNRSVNLNISPEAGTNYKQGEKVDVKVSYPSDYKADSVVYLLDSARLATRTDSSAFTLATDTMKLGPRMITAKAYSAGQVQEVSTNINVLAAKAPDVLSFEVVKTFAHDTSSYTEGLVFQDGIFYESDGGRAASPEGQSSLRKTEINGKVLQKVDVDPKIFAEGIVVVDDKIIQLTWTEKIGYVYDKKTLKLLKTFTNNVGVEGWGMCYDGERIYMDDSTNRIWFLNKDTYQATGYIDVYDDKGPVNQLNELEFIDGFIYANVYQTNDIVVINPKNGAVVQRVDLSVLVDQAKIDNPDSADVLNGIAWDAAGKRLFVTGKKWTKLYQIKLAKK